MWSDISDIGASDIEKLSDDHLLKDLQIRNTFSLLEWLKDVNKVTEDEYKTLYSMMNSSDLDNFNVAMEIIKIKKG
jgi:ribosomal protein L19E